MTTIGPARATDDAALRAVDDATWTEDVSPATQPPAGTPFFRERIRPGDVLVAEAGGRVVGYVSLHQPMTMPSHEHVLELSSLGVHPDAQRGGVGRALVEAAVAAAAVRGARKVSLHVLGHNAGARRLYEGCGFVVEGVLRAEFVLGGRDVDDVLMARHLDGSTQPKSTQPEPTQPGATRPVPPSA